MPPCDSTSAANLKEEPMGTKNSDNPVQEPSGLDEARAVLTADADDRRPEGGRGSPADHRTARQGRRGVRAAAPSRACLTGHAVFSRDRLTWGDRASDGPVAIAVTDGERVEVVGGDPAATALAGMPFTPAPGDPVTVLRQLAQRLGSYYRAEIHQTAASVEETIAELGGRYPTLSPNSKAKCTSR
jgi:hypothetical protein